MEQQGRDELPSTPWAVPRGPAALAAPAQGPGAWLLRGGRGHPHGPGGVSTLWRLLQSLPEPEGF